MFDANTEQDLAHIKERLEKVEALIPHPDYANLVQSLRNDVRALVGMVDHAKTSFASVVGKGLMTVEAAESHATERVHDFIVHMTNQLINILPSHRRGPAPETTAETPDTAQDPDQSQSGTSTGTSDAVSTAEQPAEATDQPAPAAEQSTQAVTEEPAVTAADVQTSDTPPDQRA